jgi:VWFA-related protein
MKPLLALLLVTAPALGQVRESVTVQVVEVPVYVSAAGEPVANLTRENFKLFVNGRPQAIDYFDQIDFAAIAPERARDPRQRRLYMLVFDLNQTMNDLHRARRAAIDLIDHAEVDHSFAVATVGQGARGIIVPFTRDRLAIRHAIRNLKISASGDPLRLTLTEGERGGETGLPTLIDRLLVSGEPDSDELAMISDMLWELSDLAGRLAGMEGYKHVVLLSRGFDASALHGIVSPGRAGGLRSAGAPSRGGAMLALPPNAALLGQVKVMAARFAEAGVFLDAIDTAGLRPMQELWDNEALNALVKPTGGTLIDRRNDLTDAMQVLIDRQRVVYVLGFRPPQSDRDTNRIQVKLVGAPRGVTVSHRPSYSTSAPPPDTADRLRLADIVMNDIPQHGVTANVHVEGTVVELEIPGPEMLAHAVAGTVGAEAMFYITAGSRVVAFRNKKITIDAQRAEVGLAEKPVRVVEAFDLPPGEYVAKVLVRIDGTGALGFARAELRVD